ncbi:MAG: hypothetical protein ACE5JO_09490 [Candidatus Binatia bacterium]
MPGKSDEVFVIEGEELRPLPGHPWRAGLFGKTLEEALQTLIEKYPQILPGKQMDPGSDDPPRFVLLCREMTSGGGSLDHLLVDQRGILTLLEAKLIQNPEARRAVVGQVLEYAASAVESWGNGRVRAKAAEFWSRHGKKLGDVIRENFGGHTDEEAFWVEVEQNLQQGQIRLIIATDELWPEVRRIIEYLNGEMKRAKIYGLELRCYGEESGSLVLVPNLIGQTQATRETSEVTLWSVDRLRTAYDDLPDVELGKRLRTALERAVDQGSFLETRAKAPGFGLRGRSGARIVSFFPLWTYCYLEEKSYPGGTEERDQLVAELKTVGMYDRDFNPQDVVSGRNLVRKLTDLGEDEFGTLLDIFSGFCRT